MRSPQMLAVVNTTGGKRKCTIAALSKGERSIGLILRSGSDGSIAVSGMLTVLCAKKCYNLCRIVSMKRNTQENSRCGLRHGVLVVIEVEVRCLCVAIHWEVL